MTHLFQRGEFTLASGEVSDFKIECDALTPHDWDTLAWLLSQKVAPFSEVEGVPRGGVALAEALRGYCVSDGGLLVVDDVWTTGQSMLNFVSDWRQSRDRWLPLTMGVVFARGSLPDDVVALFKLNT